MKLLGLLRKLGIYRSSSVSGTYTNAVERPTELQMDDVLDAKRDLTTKEDLKNIAGTVAASAGADPQKVTPGRKIFFWIMAVVGVLFLLGYMSSGFSFSLIIFLILWGGLLFLLKKFAFQGAYSFWMVPAVTVVICFVSLIIFPSSGGKDSQSGLQSGGDLKKFDRKVFDLAGENGQIQGVAGVEAKKNAKDGREFLEVTYHLKIKDNTPMNTSMACGGVPSIKGYNYAGNLLTPLSAEKSKPVGAFSQAYCNKEAWSTDLFGFSDEKAYNCPKAVTAGTVTDTFVPSFSVDFYSSEEFLAATTYEVYDGAQAWVKNESGDGCTLKDEVAVSQGKKLKAYTFTLTERN